ncbi:MAG: hypothetical protein J6P73_07605 [Bacteroidales bacterium]|nr:hypothetical protein [Bacteroidales bacterium]
MNKVLEFLQEHPDYSFDEGVAVLLRYSANRGVNTFITVRRDRQHLRNELNRLAHIPNLRPLPGMKDVETKAAKVETNEPKAETNEPKADENEPKAETNEPNPAESSQKEGTDNSDDDTVTYLDLNRHEREDPDKLPPTLKELWLKNRDEYKELQYCHAQMKQANSDAGRADWRKQVFEHRESIQARWKLFDEEKARLAAEAEPAAQEKPAYNPGNDRSYITNALKKETWTDKMKLEVQRRVEKLLSNSIPITEETLQRLKERGISI